jgi:hypothetical protein
MPDGQALNRIAESPYSGALFIPLYRPAQVGIWEVRVMGMGHLPGYWSGPAFVQDMPILLRGLDPWMSISALEIESQEIGIRLARGHVLIFGLGMGWAAAAAAANPAVALVTVVERDKDVIALHHALDPFAQLPDPARAKLRLIHGDAFAYAPDRPVDLLMPDIWRPIVSDGRLDEVRLMQDNVGAARVYFWGQELEIARHAVAAGRALDDAGISATVAETGLPLIGADFPDYAQTSEAAARRWMGDRWLQGPRPGW